MGFASFLRRVLKRQPILLSGFLMSLSCMVGLAGWIDAPALGQEPYQEPSTETEIALPELRAHPLPASLEQWQIDPAQGNYLDAIESTPVGALVWSQFPVQVYVEPADSTDLSGRSQDWVEAVLQAIQDWNVYLPLEVSATETTANVKILRTAPPLQLLDSQTPDLQTLDLQTPDSQTPDSQTPDRADPLARLPRVRSAESRYEILIRRFSNTPAQLRHRFTIYLTPNQTAAYTLATARHELGHALGIWGHSPQPTDALYFSQVRNPAAISARDVNTLKSVYQQPTRLGWPMPGTGS